MHGAIHGAVYGERNGALITVGDPTGAQHAELTWHEGRLVRLAVAGATVDGVVFDDPLLGPAHVVGLGDPNDPSALTAMSAIDWARPTEIPALAEPGRLPLGAGSAIVNVIAILAARAGVPALRYAGPYPTAALWRTLLRSFRTTADEAAFTAGGLERALQLSREPIPVDFAPAPHARVAIRGGFVELRDGLQRAVIDGVGFEPDATPARLVGDGSAIAAEIWFGDAPYARVATLAADGALDGVLLDGPHPIPPCTSPVIGREFPLPLRGALAELIAGAVAAPLGDAARLWCASQPLCWADLGARAAAERADGLAVHAALWDRIAPLGLGRLALALTEALVPVVTAAIVRQASRAVPNAHGTVSPPSTGGL